MDVSSNFESVPLTGTTQFSWVFIVDWILALVLTLFVIFYFNRLVGTILTFICRFYLWHRHRIRVKVQSVQLSLLGGRVFFKNFTYVGSNEIICALQGNITWRYWLHRRRLSKLETDQSEGGHVLSGEDVPTRLGIQVDGLEWFIFNRSAAYDSLYEYFTTHQQNSSRNGEQEEDDDTGTEHNTNNSSKESDNQNSNNNNVEASATSRESYASTKRDSSFTVYDNFFIRLMPIQLRCNKGAIVVGNRNTPSVLVAYFNSGIASVDVGPSKNKLDKYKMMYNSHLNRLTVEMRPNIDYKGPNAVERVKRVQSKRKGSSRAHKKAWSALKWVLNQKKRNKNKSNDGNGGGAFDDVPEGWEKSQWRGLSRYLTRDYNGNPQYNPQQNSGSFDDTEIAEEYGKYSTLVDAPEADVSYYYDIPGIVPFSTEDTPIDSGPDVGNSGTPPEFGTSIKLNESTIHYGPWADRQRIPLQSMLLPRYCCDAEPAQTKRPGDERVYTEFRLQIDFSGDNILRLPMREFSKDSKFMQDYKENPSANSLRPFGWFEVKFKDCSSIYSTSQMIPNQNGTENNILVDFKSPELRSSVNHGLLLSAENHHINVNISYPLQWNGLQNWKINNTSYGAKTFFLREHVTLLTDLLKDFSSGPPVQYELFTPVKYHINWYIVDFYIYLNINDLNIINNPSDFEDNTLVSFQGQKLDVAINIPLEYIYQNKNRVDFSINTPRFDLVVDAPPWHTLHGFVENNGVGRAHEFKLDASYTYYSDVTDTSADTLVIEIDGSDATLIAYGFIIKYLMKIRGNYFGENLHFQTLEEYFTNNNNNNENEPIRYKHERDDSDLDVLFYVYVHRGSVILPANIYNANSNIRLDFATYDTDVRFTNYYMDLQMNISPIKGKYIPSLDTKDILNTAKNDPNISDPELFIDGLVISGHRMFGLPPTEPTYFCRWAFDIGRVLINGKFEILQALARVGRSFAYTFKDVENSLVMTIPVIHDVLYVSLKVESVKVQLHTETTNLDLVTSDIGLSMNDLCNDRYSSRISVKIPSVYSSIHENSAKGSYLAASFKTSIFITNFVQKREFAYNHEQQQEHISLHDGPFQRCPFLLDPKHRAEYDNDHKTRGINPTLSLPDVPPPLTPETIHKIDPGLSTKVLLGREESISDSSASSRSRRAGSSFQQQISSTKPSLSAASSVGSLHTASSRFSSPKSRGKLRPLRRSLYDTSTPWTSAASVPRHAQYSPENNMFLPPGDWVGSFDHLPTIERSHNKEAAMNLHPTTHYVSTEEIAPKTKLDPDYEYDNFIVQFGPVEGYMGPYAISSMNSIIDSAQYQDLNATMDTLQVDVMNQIRYINLGKPEVKNARIVVPNISLKYGALHELSQASDCTSHPPFIENDRSHIYLDCKEINVVLRLTHPKRPQSLGEYMQNTEEVPTWTTLYFDVENISLGLRRGQNDSPVGSSSTSSSMPPNQNYIPLFFQIDQSEFWWNEEGSNVGSLRVKSIDSAIMSDHVSWAASFLDRNLKEVKELEKNQGTLSHTGQNRMAFMVYLLATSGEKFNIEHDPSVLTKPAYIIRSPQHVRASTSWKIIIRLRHLLKTVPEHWLKRQEEYAKKNGFTPDKHVKQEVIDIFSKWRSWELSNISESYFFRHALVESSLRESLISSTTVMYFDVENIGLRLQYKEEEDFICFDYLNFTFGWKKESREMPSGSLIVDNFDVVKADSSLSCSSIRTTFSHNLLEVYDSINSLGLLTRKPQTSSPVEPSATSPKTNRGTLPAIDLNMTIRLQSVSGSIELPSVLGRTDFSEIKMSLLFSEVDSTKNNALVSSVLHASQLKSGLYWKERQQHLVLGSGGVKDLEMSLVFSGNIITASKYLKFYSAESNLALDMPLVEIADRVKSFMELDFKMIESYFQPTFSKESTSSSLSTEKNESKFTHGPIYLKVSSSAVKADFNLLPSYSVSYYCGEVDTFFRKFEKTSFAFQVDFRKQKLDVFTSMFGNNQRIFNVLFSNMSSLCRVELSEGAVQSLDVAELVLNLGEINFSVDPVINSLITTGFESLISQMDDVSERFNNLKDMAQHDESVEIDAEKSRPTKHNQMLINVNVLVERVIVMTTFEKASLALDTRNLSIRLSSFSLLDDGTVTPKPRFGGVFTDKFSLGLIAKNIDKGSTPIVTGQVTMTFQERESESSKDELELSSDFINILLSPETIEWLYRILQSLQVKDSNNTRSIRSQGNPLSNPEKSINYSEMVKELADRTFANLLLRNVSIGWLFSSKSSSDSIPGVLAGYKKFQISTAEFKAKTTLSGFYITPAVEGDIFFADPTNTDVTKRPNTAHLPNIMLTVMYTFTNPNPSLNMRLTGDSLSICCIPSIVHTVTKSIDSFKSTSAMLHNIVSNDGSLKDSTRKESKAETPDDSIPSTPNINKRLRLPFSFHLEVEFEASIIKLWSEIDFYQNAAAADLDEQATALKPEVVPALFLQTPSVKCEVSYTLVEDLYSPDRLNMEMLVSSSNNTIHPKLIPVAVEMLNAVKMNMKKGRNTRNNRKNGSTKAGDNTTSSLVPKSNNNTDPYMYSREGSQLLSNLDVNIGIRFLRQEVTLTSVPTAKIAATVSHDLFYIGLNTCGDSSNGKFLSFSSRLKNFKASLQHIYSREVSGYASIENIMVFAAKNYSSPGDLDPVMVTGKISDIMLDINIKQMQDLELFINIWRPSGVLSEDNEQQNTESKTSVSNEGGIMYKYRRATTTVAIPWSISLGIINVQGVADMGQSVGKLRFELNKFWLSSQKSSNWEQNMMMGFDRISLKSEGRLGGGVVLRRFYVRTAIMWEDIDSNDPNNDYFPVPLVQAVAGLDSVESKISLDYHMFSIMYLRGIQLSMSNQRDSDNEIRGDKLLAVANCDVIDVYLTGLAASHFLDIYYTIRRMRSESNASYDAMLNGTSNGPGRKDEKGKRSDSVFGSVIAELTTVLDMRLGSLSCYIYPNSLTDTVVFVVAVNGANALYIQGQNDGLLESKLDMKMNEFVVALSNMKKTFPADDINQITVGDYVIYASEAAKGGTIISIPVCDIDMNTWQEFDKSDIEYTFNSSFGGRIDVGWNLGSVNFIRDMWNAHAKAFAARKEAYEMRVSSRRLSSMSIDEDFKEVKLDSAYSYIPREPPIIATPQLRDMGDATPPIEWIGLHRQRFPGLTHQVVMLPLQSLVHDFELLYRQVLGRS